MAKIYYRMVKAGTLTLDEVPARWRVAVATLLEQDAINNYTGN